MNGSIVLGVRSRALTLALAAGALALGGCGGGRSSSATHTTATSSKQTTASTPPGPPVAVVLSGSGALARTLTGDGEIEAAAADGRGGWFVAGTFTKLDGETERGLAHMRADGGIDSAWNAAISGSRPPVLAATASTLYAAAWIDDADRSSFDAFSSTTGASRPAPAVPRYGIDALATDGRLLFVAQDTGTANTAPSCLRAYDAQTAAAVATFKAEIRMQPELGCISSLTATGADVYLAGYFQAVDGVRRPGLARLNGRTGALDRAWSPPLTSCGQAGGSAGCYGIVQQVAVAPGKVFVGGSGRGVTALSDQTGTPASTWRSPPGIGNVDRIAVLGGRLFAAGDFTSSGDEALNGLAVLSAADGSLLPAWHPPAKMTTGPVVVSGSSVLVGLQARR